MQKPDSLSQNLTLFTEEFAKNEVELTSHHTSQERQPAAVQELPNNQPHQSSKQSHAENHTEQIEAASGEDHR